MPQLCFDGNETVVTVDGVVALFPMKYFWNEKSEHYVSVVCNGGNAYLHADRVGSNVGTR